MSDDALLSIYRDHPLSAKSVLARVERERGSLDLVDAVDLAVDARSEITDQNHIGGLEFTLELGARTNLSRDDRVLDVGSGIGGSARILALSHGCSVHGVELMPFRHSDAVALTELTALDARVSFERGDFLDFDLRDERFDLVVWQGSIVHFSDRARVFQRCRESLRDRGQVAIEDVCLRSRESRKHDRKLDELAELWQAHWTSGEDWITDLEGASMQMTSVEEFDDRGRRYLERLIDAANRSPDCSFPGTEQRSWQLGVELMAAGVLGYQRLIARAC